MSVFKRNDSPYYWWKLQHKKKTYGGSTGTTNKSEALAIILEQERLIRHLGSLLLITLMTITPMSKQL